MKHSNTFFVLLSSLPFTQRLSFIFEQASQTERKKERKDSREKSSKFHIDTYIFLMLVDITYDNKQTNNSTISNHRTE